LNPLAEEGRAKRTVANVAIYEWHRQMGTQVYDTVPQASLGQFIGGEAKTTVLNVAEPSLDSEEYDFATESVLLDVARAPEVDPADHPQLKLPELRRGARTVAVNVAPEAVIVNGGGELRYLAANGESATEQKLKKLATRERAPFKNLKKREETESPLDFMGKAGPKGDMPPGAAVRADMRPGMMEQNPRRKGAGRGPAGAAMGPAAGMPPGEAARMYGAGKTKGKAKGKAAR
jgi:hypothetical protein